LGPTAIPHDAACSTHLGHDSPQNTAVRQVLHLYAALSPHAHARCFVDIFV
jgi:hypothetical protein